MRQVARWQLVATLLGTVVAVVWLAYYGGLPDRAELPAFLVGVAVIVLLAIGFVVLYWHLLIRELPPHQRSSSSREMPVHQRRGMAVLLAISGINLVVGGFWDEVWHRKYGLPFGEDLFWRPHLLIYSSFLIVMILTGVAFYRLVVRGVGTLQQRFRAEPVIGKLFLLNGFLLTAIPADPLWHIIYGEDITAWSIPHLVLGTGFAIVMILAVNIQLTTLPRRPWRNLGTVRQAELLALVMLAFLLTVALQVLTTEWDVQQIGGNSIVAIRPKWALLAVVVGLGSFAGLLALSSLRLTGSATVVGVLALLIRLGLLRLFDYNALSADGWVLVLPIQVALDLYSMIIVWRGREPRIWPVGALVASSAAVLVSIPLINELLAFPDIGWQEVPTMAFVALCTVTGVGWLAQQIGDGIYSDRQQRDRNKAGAKREWMLAPVASLLLLAVLIIWFIVSAKPPV